MSPIDPNPTAPRGLRTLGIVAAVVAIAIVALGLTQRARSSNPLAKG